MTGCQTADAKCMQGFTFVTNKHKITNRCVFRKKKKKTCLKLRNGANSGHRQTIHKNNNYETTVTNDSVFLGHILAS